MSGGRRSTLSKLANFVGLWALGVVALVAVGLLIKLALPG